MRDQTVAMVCMAVVAITYPEGGRAATPTAISMYGVELGAPFSVAPCPPPPNPIVIGPRTTSPPVATPPRPPLPETCYNAAADAAQGRPSPGEYRVIPVHFTGGATPISAMNSFDVGVQDGIVQEIRIRTKGVTVQDDVLTELRDKFGAPLVDRYETLEMRDPFDYNVDGKVASWRVGEITVLYTGADGSKDRGTIELLTQTGVAHRFPVNLPQATP